jgi:GTPase SAR1 family protein
MASASRSRPSPAPALPASVDHTLKLLIIGDSGVGKSCLLGRFAGDAFRPEFASTVGVDFRVRTLPLPCGAVAKLQARASAREAASRSAHRTKRACAQTLVAWDDAFFCGCASTSRCAAGALRSRAARFPPPRTRRTQVWDTAGQERFRSITKAYYRNAHAVLLAYDCTDEASFEALHGWLASLSATLGGGDAAAAAGGGGSGSAVSSSSSLALPRGVAVALVCTKCDAPAGARVVTRERAEALAAARGVRHYETSAKVRATTHAHCLTRTSQRARRWCETPR